MTSLFGSSTQITQGAGLFGTNQPQSGSMFGGASSSGGFGGSASGGFGSAPSIGFGASQRPPSNGSSMFVSSQQQQPCVVSSGGSLFGSSGGGVMVAPSVLLPLPTLVEARNEMMKRKDVRTKEIHRSIRKQFDENIQNDRPIIIHLDVNETTDAVAIEMHNLGWVVERKQSRDTNQCWYSITMPETKAEI